jgi:DNA-binding CsgD family transcriptional regulator
VIASGEAIGRLHDTDWTLGSRLMSKNAMPTAAAERDERDNPGSNGTFASRIELLLRRLFVGRERELQTFIDAWGGADETGILLVTGELGIGKTALLNQFARLAAERGASCLRVDCRGGAVRDALEYARATLAELASGLTRPVLFVDDFHRLSEAEERWFIETYLPTLPTPTMVVIADRRDISRVRAELASLVSPFCRRINLRPLSTTDSLEYLHRRNVAEATQSDIVAFSAGVPLLLALAAELTLERDAPLESLEAAVLPHIVRGFIEFMDTNEHRTALATLAVARSLGFELLADVLGTGDNVDETYRWLTTLSFAEQTPLGLRPHRVARLACRSYLRQEHWRLFWSVGEKVCAFYDRQVREPVGPRGRWMADRLYLEPVRPTSSLDIRFDDDAYEVHSARLEDHEALLRLTERRDGIATARWIQRWLDAGIAQCDVLRAPDGTIGGYLLGLPIARVFPPAISDDPAFAILGAFLAQKGWTPSLEPTVLVTRSVLLDGADPTQASMLLVNQVLTRLMALPHLHYHFGVTQRPEAWRSVATSMGFTHVVAGTYDDGAFEHSVVAYDWRSRGRGADASAAGARFDDVPARHSAPEPLRALTGQREFGNLLRAQLAQLASAAALSSREKEVLDLLVLGRNATEIGKVLGISARTAKFHQARLLAKLGADSRSDLIRLLL